MFSDIGVLLSLFVRPFPSRYNVRVFLWFNLELGILPNINLDQRDLNTRPVCKILTSVIIVIMQYDPITTSG